MADGPSTAPDERVRRGGCACGAVRFEAAGDPLWVAYCHCGSCRRQTASPVTLYAGFADERVRFTATAPTVHESSPGVERGFCGTCGTPVHYAAPGRWPGEIHLFTCNFEAPETFEPRAHVYFHERLPGFDVADELPRR